MTPSVACVLLLPPVAAAAGARVSRHGRLHGALLGLLAWEAGVVWGGLLLGHLGLLRTAPFVALHAGLLAACAVLLVRGPANRSPASTRLRRLLGTRRGAALGALFVAVAAALAVPTLEALLFGLRDFDGLAYHAPRALAWSRQGGFAPFETPVWHQVGLPVAADVLLGAPLLAGGGSRLAGLPTLWLTVGTALAVFSIARSFGVAPSRAAGAALLFLSFPITGQRVAQMSSDAAAAFPLLAAFALAVRARRPAAAAAPFALGAGLAVAAKLVIAPFVLLLAVPLLLGRERGGEPGRRPLAIALLGVLVGAAVVAASYAPVVAATGDPLGGRAGRSLGTLGGGPASMVRSVGFAALGWVVEPLGYVPRAVRDAVLGSTGLGRALTALGPTSPDEPVAPNGWPSTSRTGIVPLVLVPALLAFGPRRLAVPLALFLGAGFLLLQAPLSPALSSARFGIPLVAAFAVACWLPLGVAPVARRALPLLLTLAMALASGAASVRWAAAAAAEREAIALGEGEGLSPADRALVESRVGEGELLLLSELGRRDGLVAGPDAGLAVSYLAPAAPGEPGEPFLRAAARGEAVFLPTPARGTLRAGPSWSTGREPGPWSVAQLRDLLASAGFRPALRRPAYEVWTRDGALSSSPGAAGEPGRLDARAAGRRGQDDPGRVQPEEEQ